jgi:hypothetical protein
MRRRRSQRVDAMQQIALSAGRGCDFEPPELPARLDRAMALSLTADKIAVVSNGSGNR